MDQTNNYDGTFEFAFNDPCFSDRVLKVVVIAGPQDEKLKAKLGDGVTKRLLDLKREVACQEENVQVLRTEQFYVNSAILASKSPFFYKLFPSGMREIDPQCEAIIKIDASENVALMELLHYMYGGKLFLLQKKVSSH
ncbi:BTB/POZ domain-containing protein POB1 [Acorus calamus]|uniref:BTB/POZ domain-containing protein POB1 n=1 Tax=Acorus calamus TaxID=4465 RepID=A0AAV9C6K1_ACOCL|nr:BTB/POZ domain-containing protein POB1 [Acorus calamus]